MEAWTRRMPAVATMLNPALITLIASVSTEEYRRVAEKSMPLSLIFLITPLVLHKDTRIVLPSTTATHLAKWVSEHPVIWAGFPERAKQCVPFIWEGLRFGTRHGVLAVAPGGLVSVPAPHKGKPPVAGDIASIVRASGLLGRWLTKIDNSETAYALFGVTP